MEKANHLAVSDSAVQEVQQVYNLRKNMGFSIKE